MCLLLAVKAGQMTSMCPSASAPHVRLSSLARVAGMRTRMKVAVVLVALAACSGDRSPKAGAPELGGTFPVPCPGSPLGDANGMCWSDPANLSAQALEHATGTCITLSYVIGSGEPVPTEPCPIRSSSEARSARKLVQCPSWIEATPCYERQNPSDPVTFIIYDGTGRVIGSGTP